jgi:uncharacterized membrane protein
MLARAIVDQTEDGVVIDYVRADVARGPKRKANRRLTPTEEMQLRDKVWKLLANHGLTTHEISEACRRAAQSERNIRRRLERFEAEAGQAQAG